MLSAVFVFQGKMNTAGMPPKELNLTGYNLQYSIFVQIHKMSLLFEKEKEF
jgi:hypothetical protein